MPDNVGYTAGAGTLIAADEITYSGDTAKAQLFRPVHVSGAEGSKTVTEIVTAPGSPASFALNVQLPSVTTHHLVLVAGTNAVRIKNGAGRLKRIKGLFVGTAPIWIKFHDTAANPPTAGTGVVYTVGAQAGFRVDDVISDGGKAFATGIGCTIVVAAADANADGLSAGEEGVFEIDFV